MMLPFYSRHSSGQPLHLWGNYPAFTAILEDWYYQVLQSSCFLRKIGVLSLRNIHSVFLQYMLSPFFPFLSFRSSCSLFLSVSAINIRQSSYKTSSVRWTQLPCLPFIVFKIKINENNEFSQNLVPKESRININWQYGCWCLGQT